MNARGGAKNFIVHKTFSAVISIFIVAFSVTAGHAQTFSALHQFNGAVVGGVTDGANPQAGLLRDAGGNLFGTTFDGGIGEGVAFKLDSAGK